MTWLNKCHFGDVRDVLAQMINAGVKVNTIVTSPPYWGLRSYLPDGHPDTSARLKRPHPITPTLKVNHERTNNHSNPSP